MVKENKLTKQQELWCKRLATSTLKVQTTLCGIKSSIKKIVQFRLNERHWAIPDSGSFLLQPRKRPKQFATMALCRCFKMLTNMLVLNERLTANRESLDLSILSVYKLQTSVSLGLSSWSGHVTCITAYRQAIENWFWIIIIYFSNMWIWKIRQLFESSNLHYHQGNSKSFPPLNGWVISVE